MEYKPTKMKFADLKALLVSSGKVGHDVSNTADDPSWIGVKGIVKPLGNLPAVCYYEDVGGVNYIYMQNKSKTLVDEVFIVTDPTCQRDIIKQFVIDEYNLWQKDDESYFEVLSAYGIDECKVEVESDNTDGLVEIWVQRHFELGYRNPLTDYSKLQDGWDDEYDIAYVQDAMAHIRKLIRRDYVLAPNELRRPTYEIVD